ncbi:MAG: right-handed parallel beta-helix repeat-containing protein [Candidatus Cloacimonadaceae bacterium]
MKTTLLAIIFLTSLTIAFSAELLFFDNFNSGMPVGWDTQGPESWHINASGYAFDDPPELMLDPEPGTGIRRFISPPINTLDYNELQFIFWHFLLADPSNTNPFTISIQVTNNGIDWTTLWETTTAVDIPQEMVSVIISRTYLNTANFQISFACTGTYGELLGWYIDNMQMNINSRIASGTWTLANSPYYLQCDHIIPSGYSLIIEPGVEVIGYYETEIEVYGYLQAQGTAADSIRFTSTDSMIGWRGITIHQYEHWELKFSYCIFEDCMKETDEFGGALQISFNDNVYIENCRFTNNFAGNGGAISVYTPWEIYVSNCMFNQNRASGEVSTLYVVFNDMFYLSDCAFHNNIFAVGTNLSHVLVNVMSTHGFAYLYSNTFAMNYGGNSALQFMGDVSYGYEFFLINIYNSIFWNPYISNEVSFVDAFSGVRTANFYYCDVNSAQVIGTTPNYTDCIDADPLFVSLEDCHLLGTSPCINTGHLYMVDPDGSRKDMGAFPIFNKAIIQTVEDVPYDQGRQVEVFWKRSEMDNTWMPGSFYSVWRGDTFRGQDGVFINSPVELSSLEDLSNVYWLERDIAWNYIGQCPAYNFPNYGFICPTLQDSSATGNNAAPFRVAYQWANGFSTSAEVDGYSVDNIPPDPVRYLVISKDNSDMRLDWTAVTTGTYNGTPFPELNSVFYKIYCSDDPYYDIGPATYLTTTTETFRLIDYLTDDRKFFRIVVSDQ